VGLDQDAGGALDLAGVGAELSVSDDEVRGRIERAEACGLVLSASGEGGPPLLLDAGRQYLELRGEVEAAVLAFLAGYIDDLHARASRLRAGTLFQDDDVLRMFDMKEPADAAVARGLVERSSARRGRSANRGVVHAFRGRRADGLPC